MSDDRPNASVMVVGGGMAGIQASLDLAEAGCTVYLVEQSPAIGGLMTQLDRTFPTNNCDLCTISPHLAETRRGLNIELLNLTQIKDVQGEQGNFKVTLISKPRYIDTFKCTACGECHRKFPDCVNLTPGLDHRAPTCMRYPKVIPEAFSIDMEKCKDVDSLVKVCPAGAIVPDDSEKVMEIQVSSIVLAPGAELFDPKELPDYGYGKFKNVVTGLEYERLLSASGPTLGKLVRPSDGKVPKRIAWIQCVGSRNINQADTPYCSSVCCMYALKEGIITKERFRDDIELVVFYMDMRTTWKDYELYYQRAKDEYGIKFVRSRPHTIDCDPKTDDLLITYTLEKHSQPATETFDMVVLSTGFRVPASVIELGEKLGIQLNEHGFVSTSSFNPVATSKPGVYVCGLFESPKDIPETLIQASAAACMAGKGFPPSVKKAGFDDQLPPERDVSAEPVKIGVFVCDCGYNIGSVVDVDKVASYAQGLRNVELAEVVGHGCSNESLQRIQQVIKEKGLNRVVIGGCSPRAFELKFQDCIRKAGLNRYLLEMANIRDQDTWVHMDKPEEATEKAKDIVRMAVAKASLIEPLQEVQLEVKKAVLVIGGGVAGMEAALGIAEQGYKAYLIEKTSQLGGVAPKLRTTWKGEQIAPYVDSLIKRVQEHPDVEVLLETEVESTTGIIGNFVTTLVSSNRKGDKKVVEHGATILATGGKEYKPTEYLYGEHPSVLTHLDFDQAFTSNDPKIKEAECAVFIQCVGSRIPERPYCSRTCCTHSLESAIALKETKPEMDVYVLYRDMRSYGFREDLYRKARELGVVFARYELEHPPELKNEDGNKLSITVMDQILGKSIKISPDVVVLATAIVPNENKKLFDMLKIPVNDDGFLTEAHTKLRPVDAPINGVFIAGLAHCPKSIDESIAQANAAVARAMTILARDVITLGGVVATVIPGKCAVCLTCVRTCPYGAPSIGEDGHAVIDLAECRGCGICVAECPGKAIVLQHFTDDQIIAKIDASVAVSST